MSSNILFISLSNNLTEITRRVTEELNVNIDIYESSLKSNIISYIKEKESQYHVFISIASIVNEIRQIVNKPVLSVQSRNISKSDTSNSYFFNIPETYSLEKYVKDAVINALNISNLIKSYDVEAKYFKSMINNFSE